MRTIEIIEQELEEATIALKSKENRHEDFDGSFEEYQNLLEPELSIYQSLMREKRMIVVPTFSEFGKWDGECLMSLNDFVEDVECGGFCDYDGFGYYAMDGKVSDILVYPSDIKSGNARREFSHVVWYNK